MFDERTRLVARQLRKRPTRSEAILWSALRGRKLEGVKFRRQHVIGRYIADFYAASYRLVIENDFIVLRIDAHVVEADLPRALEMIRSALRHLAQ